MAKIKPLSKQASKQASTGNLHALLAVASAFLGPSKFPTWRLHSKRFFLLGYFPLIVLVLLAFPCEGRGEIKLFESKEGKQCVKLEGEVFGAYEFWDWFTPSNRQNVDYDYFSNRARAGLRWVSPKLESFIQLQYSQLFNLPGAGLIAAAPQGPFGFGPTYFAHTGERFAHSVFIKQMAVDLKDPLDVGLSGRIGRFEYFDGAETLSGDPKLDKVTNLRISERLVGPFGASNFTRSFDGFWAWFDKSLFRLDQLLTRPTQGGFEERAGNTIEKIDLLVTTLTLKKSTLIPNTRERLFLIYYGDHRPVTQRVDNSEASTASRVDVDIRSYGMDIVGAYPVGTGEADALAWLVLQEGDWYEQDHRAFAWALEGGYQFKQAWSKPWIRMGYGEGSGDSNPGDKRHETFFQILPTVRKYSLFTLYNLMNNRDLFVQGIVKPWEKWTLRSDWHLVTLDERSDRLYTGAGATQEKGSIFGYVGRNSFGKLDVGNLLDLTVTYEATPSWKITTYFGHFFGGSVIDKIYPGDSNANLLMVDMTVKF